MLTNSLQGFVLHYTIFAKQSDVTCDFKKATVWRFFGRQHQLGDVLLNFQLSPRRVTKDLAERVGFEPTVGFLLHTLSKRAP